MAFSAITTEGALFPADLMERLAAGAEPSGQRPEDFGLKSGQRLSDEMQAAFADIRSQWDAYQRRLKFSKESSTTLTRESWVIPLLERLGFVLEFQRRAATAGADTFAFSHRAGDDPEAPPVHIVAHDQRLDQRGEARRSPHALVQEYLNRTDALWGLVTNGERLRLLRDTARLARPTYVEFDLRALVEGNLYSEFVLLYRLLHRTRFPQGAADAHECRLEKYYQQGLDEGGRVREHLREGVEVALQELGTAFLAHPESHALREALQGGRLRPEEYYRQLLRLVYRFLFLMVAEERRLLFPPEATHPERQEIYSRYYSLNRLRQRCERRFAADRFSDLWAGLRQTFRLFQSEAAARQLGLAPLDGELFGPFACPYLEEASCENARLLRALYHLSTFTDGGVRRRVNYTGLDTEELGSIYESLLEYHPHVSLEPPRFALISGSERRQTGSYYTPPELVKELIDSALVPVLEERLATATNKEEKEAVLRALKICDPASGSGHFLLAAARRLGQELARVRTGEAEPAPEAYREAVRDIIRECLYAVDKNPLAVDLCKVALWMEGHCIGLPLSFLDHHVKCGDSLVGVMDLAVLKEGIPDAAYKPVTGDDKQAASQYKRRNKEERERQSYLFQEQLAQAADGPRALAPDFVALSGLTELTPQDVQAKAELYEALRQGGTWHQLQVTCDLWTAAFFSHLIAPPPGQSPLVPTTATVWGYLSQGSTQPQLEAEAMSRSIKHPFFHWPLEFPEVFAAGGFDVVLGNPPWERIKLQEQEFFAGRDHEIAQAPNRAARERLIGRLPETNPALAAEFVGAKHQAEAQSKFVRECGRFPLCAKGDINTYAIFAEAMRQLINRGGRAGCIVPSAIATGDTTKLFFQNLIKKRSLISLYSFFEIRCLFPATDSRDPFCLLTLTGSSRPNDSGADFAFNLLKAEDIKKAKRCFSLSAEEISLLNPNTQTCPIFRSHRDAELTKDIYRRVPVLIKDGPPEENPWGIKFSTMFHMSNDSHFFRTRSQLEAEGWRLSGNVLRRGEEVYLPLYEAKMMRHFDHRWATHEGTDTRDVTLSQKNDPNFLVMPRYWMPEREVVARTAQAPKELIQGWLQGEHRKTSEALTAWLFGYHLNRDLTPSPRLQGTVQQYSIISTKARVMEQIFSLTEEEVTQTEAIAAEEEALALAEALIRARLPHYLLGWRNNCRNNDERTAITGILPNVGVGNSFPLIFVGTIGMSVIPGLLANLSSFCFDYCVRQKLSGANLNFYIFKQLPVFPPAIYDRACSWFNGENIKNWLTPRVLELTYTANDLAGLAQDLGYYGLPFCWDDERRFLIRCELDAAFFHLYGISQQEVEYIMGTFNLVRDKDHRQFGEYRTKRVILEIYDDLQRAMATGEPYRTRLDPPLGDPRAAHGSKTD